MIKRMTLAIVCLFGLAASAAVPTQSNMAPAVPKSTDVIRALTPAQRLQARQREAQKDGIGILKHVVNARTAIRTKNLEGARADLIQAEAVLDHLRLEEPAVTAKDRLTIARQRLNYDTPETVLRDLAPIYDELTALDSYAPQTQARGYVDQARADLLKRNSKAAQYHLQMAERSVTQAQVEIPMDDISTDLASANLALEQKNWTTADRWLASVETRLAAPVNAVALIPSAQNPTTAANAPSAKAPAASNVARAQAPAPAPARKTVPRH